MFFKRLLLLILLIMVSLLNLVGCNISKRSNFSELNTANKSVVSNNSSDIVSDVKDISSTLKPSNKYDSSKLDTVTKKIESLKEMENKEFFVGYGSTGQIFVWVNVPYKDYKIQQKTMLDEQKKSYQSFLSKILYDASPEIDNICLYTDYGIVAYFTNILKDTYRNSGLNDKSKDIVDFFNDKKAWYKSADKFWNPDICILDGGKYNPREMIAKQLNELYGLRLSNFQMITTSNQTMTIDLNIKGFPSTDNSKIILNEEIAKALVIGLGRENDTYYWDSVDKMKISYSIEDKKIFELEMLPDSGEKSKGFNNWLKEGLKISDCLKYCNMNIYDSNFKFGQINEKEEKVNKTEISAEMEYSQIMDSFTKYNGVKTAFLGRNTKGYNAVIFMDANNEDDVFKKEIDLTSKIITMPINSIWFICEGKNNVKMTYLNKGSFNILYFLYKDNFSKIKDNDWPLLVTKYWETSK